ncbi:MAG: transcriptional regulator [Rubrivivax sp.]|nr:MAG: transcriptional regulator [Rubrivivax sp.]
MKLSIRSPEELGSIIRAVRKHARVRQDDLAGTANVSKQFAVDAERGKATMQFGKLLQLLDELGITLTVDIADDIEPTLKKIEARRADGSPGKNP